MHPPLREPFNRIYSEALFERYRSWLFERLGPFPFRLAETPLFLSRSLLDYLKTSALEIAAQLAVPSTLAALKRAIPDAVHAPGMSALPDCVQIDFALVRGPSGAIEGRVVELQAFPSLCALETIEADAWNHAFQAEPSLQGTWTCFFSEDRAQGMELMRSCIVGDEDPVEVALVDYRPMEQKTSPDFRATKLFFDVDSVCVTEIEKEGRRLYRRKGNKRVPIRRIYNRLVFDELDVKNVALPFSWKDDLDVTWCSHPNWYWTWSKYSLPYLEHEAVPKTRFLSEIESLPQDLENYVMKPLFSYAGSGVIVDVTREAVDRVPAARRAETILQRKVEYAWVIPMPHADGPLGAHNAVKAEVRVMLLRRAGGATLEPLLPLVRFSRGKMLGVDHNMARETEWTGGGVGIWLPGR